MSLPFVPGVFDVVLCHSVFNYLNDQQDARRCLTEMLRTLMHNEMIYIGDVNDPDKQDSRHRIRSREKLAKVHISNAKVDQLFLAKAFFRDFCRLQRLRLDIVDETRFDLPFYSNSEYRYAVLIRNSV